jgi:MFS family permease
MGDTEAAYRQVYLLAAARTCLQALRLAVGTLVVFMQAELGFSTLEKGRLLAAFPAGYLLSQVAGGVAADRFGGKPVMTMALVASAVCTGLLSAVASVGGGVHAVAAVLFVEGLLQGPTFPTNAVILGRWITPVDRSWANSVTEAGSPLGGLLAMGVTPVLATSLGWHGACAVFGLAVLGFAWCWHLRAASTPEQCAYLGVEERARLTAAGLYSNVEDRHTAGGGGARSAGTAVVGGSSGGGGGGGGSGARIPWHVLLHPSALAVMLCHSSYNFGRYFLYYWMPTFMHEAFHLEPELGGERTVSRHLCGLSWPRFTYVTPDLVKKHSEGKLRARCVPHALGAAGCRLDLVWWAAGLAPHEAAGGGAGAGRAEPAEAGKEWRGGGRGGGGGGGGGAGASAQSAPGVHRRRLRRRRRRDGADWPRALSCAGHRRALRRGGVQRDARQRLQGQLPGPHRPAPRAAGRRVRALVLPSCCLPALVGTA